jgi:Arm DNA-binding domain
LVRAIHRLSSAKVKSAKSRMHPDGGGLYLQVAQAANGTNSKSWLFRFATNGRERQMGLGSLTVVSLSKARERAAECRRLRDEGIDPIAARNSQRAMVAAENAKQMTFDQCAAGYIAAHCAGWRNPKHASQWVNTLATYVSPVFGKLPVGGKKGTGPSPRAARFDMSDESTDLNERVQRRLAACWRRMSLGTAA